MRHYLQDTIISSSGFNWWSLESLFERGPYIFVWILGWIFIYLSYGPFLCMASSAITGSHTEAAIDLERVASPFPI